MVSPFGAELVGALERRHPSATITHVEHVPARRARYAEWPEWVEPRLKQLLIDDGFASPYLHQAQCAELAWQGRDVVVATGTSSGKSLGYQLPVLTALAQDPTACAIYLTPTKALGSDQLQATLRMTQGAGLAGIHPAPYDGDTPVESRTGIREHTRYVFTNPDMLHAGLLGSHARWARLLRHLKYVVVDECHTYRGVFGANVAPVSYTHLTLPTNREV